MEIYKRIKIIPVYPATSGADMVDTATLESKEYGETGVVHYSVTFQGVSYGVLEFCQLLHRCAYKVYADEGEALKKAASQFVHNLIFL